MWRNERLFTFLASSFLTFYFNYDQSKHLMLRLCLLLRNVLWPPHCGNAKKHEYFWTLSSVKLIFLQQNCFESFDLGLNWKNSTPGELFCWINITFVPCIRIMTVQKFRSVAFGLFISVFKLLFFCDCGLDFSKKISIECIKPVKEYSAEKTLFSSFVSQSWFSIKFKKWTFFWICLNIQTHIFAWRRGSFFPSIFQSKICWFGEIIYWRNIELVPSIRTLKFRILQKIVILTSYLDV